jgi:anti-sigma B factor antagonist
VADVKGNGRGAKTPAAAGPCVVRCETELDVATAPELIRDLDRHIADGHRRVVVDMSDTTFMDSSGLRALLLARQRMEEDGGSLLLSGCSPQVLRVFEATGLSEHFQIFGSRDDALAGA